MDGECAELEWSPIVSAPVHSAFAGVLAGLVFAGIVVLLSGAGDQVRRTNALVTFGSSFLVLAFDAFLFGVIAGERVCGRAWTETLYASGLLGLGALGIFAGICWLIDAGDTTSGRMTRFYVVTTYVIALIVSYHVGATAIEYLDDLRRTSSVPGWLVAVAAVYRWVMLVAVLLVGAWPRFRRRWGTLVTSTAYAYVACVVLALYGAGGASGSAQDWTHPSAALIAGNTVLALAFPALAVLAQVVTLPSRVLAVVEEKEPERRT
ncbi:hypothetical protein [Dactylosporangium sp. NPDC049140]|uniref:hypothetical protein n=1 Tax=Dactylosporangium sp. NPDC049140 TaxID=3155647 RepID=UPI0033CC7ADF